MNFIVLKKSTRVLEKSWKFVSEKGYEPCDQFAWCPVLSETHGESLTTGCGVFGIEILIYFICNSRCI